MGCSEIVGNRLNRKRLLRICILLLMLVLVYRLNHQKTSSDNMISPASVNIREVKLTNMNHWVISEGTLEGQRKACLSFDRSDTVVYIGKTKQGGDLREGSMVFGPGDDLSKGQLLAQIDHREVISKIAALEAQLLSAKNRKQEATARRMLAMNEVDLAKQTLQRIEHLYQQGLTAQEQREQADLKVKNAEMLLTSATSQINIATHDVQQIKANLNQSTIILEKNSLFAPFDGVITAMNIRKHSHSQPNMAPAGHNIQTAPCDIIVMELHHYELPLEIPDHEAQIVREGQTVYLAANQADLYMASQQGFSNGQIAKGEVWSISPSINPRNHSRRIRVRVEANESLRDGGFIHAWIHANTISDAITLPLTTISFNHEDAPFVFVVRNNLAEQRWLTLGHEIMDQVEVVHGVSAGEWVITHGYERLKHNSPVQIIGHL